MVAWGVAAAVLVGMAALGAFMLNTVVERAPGWIKNLERPRIATVDVIVPDSDIASAHPTDAEGNDRLPVIRYIAPRWVTPPRPDFPPEAIRAGIPSASVVLECSAAATGELRQCRVAEEQPEGFGFGAAALEAASAAQVSPAQIEDAPTDATIRFRTQFELD